ncbi:hypothetical protein CPB83DRAFT_774598 [Crepidotus variabilis]|uniref:Uncharacterized protein n=1 Tax=Crepidotus variabilis TaxID=179855 RepID=A0A9P6JK88_9AGAR|nr:hypothetical protein CPB83DRAFT_774598 [Crepidotus variabilis]
MSAKFLCCLPLRLGVLIISFLQFLLFGGLAGLTWYALWYDHKSDLSQLTKSMQKTAIAVGVIYTVASLLGLLGFLGAIFRKNGFVKSFYILLCIVFGFEIGSSIMYLVTFYRTRNQTFDDCVGGSTDVNKISYCRSLDIYRKIPQGYMIASIIIPILIHAYAIYVVYQYSKRLAHQKAEKTRLSSHAAYQPVAHQDDSFAMNQPYNAAYPYAAGGAHSFGHTHGDNKV